MDSLIERLLHEGRRTPRLTLRPLRMCDADDMYAYTGDSATCRFLNWGPHTQKAQAQEFIHTTIAKYQSPTDIVWGVEETTLSKLIGVIRIYDICDESATVSYILNRAYTNRGYATEALRAVIFACFTSLGLKRVYAYFVEDNIASRRVMEHVGMTQSDSEPQMITIKGKSTLLYERVIFAEGMK